MPTIPQFKSSTRFTDCIWRQVKQH